MSKTLSASGRESPPFSFATFQSFAKGSAAQAGTTAGTAHDDGRDSTGDASVSRPYQVLRYAVTGVTAVCVRTLGFYVFSIWLPSDGALLHLSNHQRAINNLEASALAFVVSNLVAYLLSVKWVFVSGRHSRRKEFVLFTTVSLVGLGLGFLAGPLLIAWYGISHHLAFFNSLVMCLAVNFVGRKFFVFKE